MPAAGVAARPVTFERVRAAPRPGRPVRHRDRPLGRAVLRLPGRSRPAIAGDMGWSIAAVTAAFSTGLVVSALVGIPVGRLARPDRSAPGDDGPGRFSRCRPCFGIATAPSLPVVLRRVGAGRGGDGRNALPAGVRRTDPLVGTPAAGGIDRVDAAGRAGEHDLRPAHGDPARGTSAGGTPTSSSPLCSALVTIPAHLLGLRGRWPDPDPAGDRPDTATDQAPDAIARSRPFLLLTAAVGARGVHRVRGRGQPGPAAPRARRVHLRSPRGRWASEASGRCWVGFGYGRLTERLQSARSRGVGVLACPPPPPHCSPCCPARPSLVAVAMLAGAARGVFTLLQATAISDRWGAVHYGRLNGLLSAPALTARPSPRGPAPPSPGPSGATRRCSPPSPGSAGWRRCLPSGLQRPAATAED